MSQATTDPRASQTRAFFDQWTLYASILRQDYMYHHKIEAALRTATGATPASALRLLDLGCGDAHIISAAFGPERLAAYTGVDLSPVALTHAEENLADVVPTNRCELLKGHFSEFLAGSAPDRFDAILIGFALHHLNETEKRAFFEASARVLVAGGTLWLYDVFRRPHESRNAYLEAYRTLFIDRWGAIPADARDRIDAHVRTSDFPETPATILAMAADAGLATPTGPLFADEHNIHCLYRFDLTNTAAAQLSSHRSSR